MDFILIGLVAFCVLMTIGCSILLMKIQSTLDTARDERIREAEWLCAKVDNYGKLVYDDREYLHAQLDAVTDKAMRSESPETSLRRTIVQMAHALVDSTVALRKPEALPSSRRATEVALRGPGYVENPDPAKHSEDTYTLWQNAEEV